MVSILAAIFYHNTKNTIFLTSSAKGAPSSLLTNADGTEADPVDPDPFSRNKLLPTSVYMFLRSTHTVLTILAILAEYSIVYSHSQLLVSEAEQEAWIHDNGYTYEQLSALSPEDMDAAGRKRTFRSLAYKSPR